MTKRGRATLCAVAGAITLTMAAAPSASAIIGGHDATAPYPFMVSIQKDGHHYCGASLIKPDWIVTAGHCTVNVKPQQLSVRVGDHDRTKGAQAKVIKVIAHPDFSYEPFRNDVAVMKLDHPVDAKPIKLAAKSGPVGTSTRILGWGMTCEDGNDCPNPRSACRNWTPRSSPTTGAARTTTRPTSCAPTAPPRTRRRASSTPAGRRSRAVPGGGN